MQGFTGFPSKTSYVGVPSVFFSEIMPVIADIAELKVTLYIFLLLPKKRGFPKFLTLDELAGDRTLMKGLKEATASAEEALCRGLELASSRGTILHVTAKAAERLMELYFLNSEADRKAVARIESGELDLGQGWAKMQPPKLERPNLFTLYEQNIGIMTPLVADELREAEKLYPVEWIEAAFKEAVSLNKRNLRYILRILETWATEGIHDGKSGRNPKEDTEKYFRGKFGHLVQH